MEDLGGGGFPVTVPHKLMTSLALAGLQQVIRRNGGKFWLDSAFLKLINKIRCSNPEQDRINQKHESYIQPHGALSRACLQWYPIYFGKQFDSFVLIRVVFSQLFFVDTREQHNG